MTRSEPKPLARVWDHERHDSPPHQDVEASDQIADAINDLHRHPGVYMHWPWGILDDLTGSMAPADVWYLCAFSGGGKTTFLASAVNRWMDAGRKVFVLPLETQPKKFRTYLACQRLGIYVGDALTGKLRERNDPALEPLTEELRQQIHDTSKLKVKSVPEINVGVFEAACEEAADYGADVLIVDHIDHIEGGDGSNLWAESVRVNKAALRCAQRFNLLLVLASQLNQDSVRGTDHLAKYQPPREHHVQMGGHKRQVATGMIGLYRPLRAPRHGESEDQYKEQLRAARQGSVEPKEALMPNTMGVISMKSRNYGTKEGCRIGLRFENGRVVDPDTTGVSDEKRYGL